MAKRSFETREGMEDDDEDDDDGSETESETEEEEREERKVMIRVVPRERFESGSLIRSHSATASCSGCGGGGGGGGGGGNVLSCQADECGADLRDAKQYHRRHRVCQQHAKAACVLVKGSRQRFCQQCSRFHELSEFDGTKRSCRNRLAGHNERRRKVQCQSDLQAEDVKRSPTSEIDHSMVKMKAATATATHPPNHGELTLQGCSNTKHCRIR